MFPDLQSVDCKTLSKSKQESGIWAVIKQRKWERRQRREGGLGRRRAEDEMHGNKGKGLVRDKTLGEPDINLGVAGYILSLLETLILNISKHKTKTSH